MKTNTYVTLTDVFEVLAKDTINIKTPSLGTISRLIEDILHNVDTKAKWGILVDIKDNETYVVQVTKVIKVMAHLDD